MAASASELYEKYIAPVIAPPTVQGTGDAVSGGVDMPDPMAKVAQQIQDQGGVTFNPRTGAQPTQGFAVSTHPGREKILPQPPTAQDLRQYLGANQDAFESDPGAHLGAWQNDGKYYLDVSHIDPDANSAMEKARGANQRAIFDLGQGTEIQNPDYAMQFLHMSNLSDPSVTLDPKFYGRGIRGAEARRGGMKSISLYPADLPLNQVEHGLESKTPYRVSVPAAKMYDANADTLGLMDDNRLPDGSVDMSGYEDAIKNAGFSGYHVPQGGGILRGQGRLFEPTPATRLGAEDTVPDAAQGAPEPAGDAIEAGPEQEPSGDTISRYAPEAEHLASQVQAAGKVTYNPSTGDVPNSGYIVPTAPERSVALDHPPDPEDIHGYLMQNQDAFDDPSNVLHIHTEPGGSFMHVANYSPDYGAASDAAIGTRGFQDIGTGEIHPPSTPPTDTDASPEGPQAADEYLTPPAPARAPWRPGRQTVSDPNRNAFPGIYQDPAQIVAQASDQVAPEDPMLQRLFGVSRQDLSDTALSRQGNELGTLPGAAPNPRGSGAAEGVMQPRNEQRLRDVLDAARTNAPDLYRGMTGWYVMDPLFERFRQIFGDDLAPEKYSRFNTLLGMASPGTPVHDEIKRGTAAHWLNEQGRFADFAKYGGQDGSGPTDMAGIPGHAYHSTAQLRPMQTYVDTGQMQMKSAKVPTYIHASGVPATGFQTNLPVGDAHWTRAVGLSDTRGPALQAYGKSALTSEMNQLGPWWQSRVANPSGMEAVPAQALLWGAMAPQTGVESAVGSPKLEMLATQIGKTARRLGVSPETARDLIIQGKAGAF